MSNQVFVGNIHWDATDDDLRGAFEGQGFKVEYARVMKDEETGQGRGFGFVTLDERTAQDAAIDRMSGVAIRGRDIRVEPAKGVKVRR